MNDEVPYALKNGNLTYRSGWSIQDKPAEVITTISSIPAGLIALIGGVKVSAAMSFIFTVTSANGMARGVGAVWFIAAIIALVGMVREDFSLEIVGVRLMAVAYSIYGMTGIVAAVWGGVGSALTGVLSLSVAVWLMIKGSGLAHERSREMYFRELQLEVGRRKQQRSNDSLGEDTEERPGS